MPGVRIVPAVTKTIVIGTVLTVALICACLAPARAFAIPHGGFTAYTVSCQSCHPSHSAETGSDLALLRRNETELCYACHDGLGSVYDVKSSFGTSEAPAVSAHPVSDETLTCASCHTPHFGPEQGNPRSLAVGPSHETSGNAVCGVCHGEGSSLPSGDLVTTFTASAHDVTASAPPSGTNIRCLACHQPHGSSNLAILRTSLTSLSGATYTVSVTATSGPRPLCEGCHDAPRNGYPGTAAYGATKHGSRLDSLVGSLSAAAQYPGVTQPAGDCEQCHAPHGTADPTLLRASGRQLCFDCHDVSWASRPATASYTGATVYLASAHASIGTTPGAQDDCTVCHAVHGGGESNPDGSTPSGELHSPSGALCVGKGTGCHSVASNSAAGVNVLAAFDATTNDLTHHDVRPASQARTGAKTTCTNCHDPHRESASDTFSDPDAIRTSMSSGPGRFVDAGGHVGVPTLPPPLIDC